MRIEKLEAAIEAILFAAGEAVSLSRIAEAIAQDGKTTALLIKKLIDQYEAEGRGIRIIEIDGSYQMCTNPDYYAFVQELLKNPQRKILTQALIETLAIIAYKQPVTKAQIEEIRGVNADHAVNKLMEYRLVVEKGRLDAPYRPILFGTSDEFLKYFGFNNLASLPDLPNDLTLFQIEAETEIDNILGD
ncbi:MAG: SMC-Scp complex subunit ScpB [Clostridiales bacterium]|jgi:segregation and condensation protein B|nr:SMC-Scp complex subunit ScpB [Clostridiales bacterium]